MNIWVVLFSLIPAITIAVAFYFSLKKVSEEVTKGKLISLKAENNKIITPIRFQAYERIILLLERLTPSSIIFRITKANMTSQELHTALLEDIRSEFEHNLSQQLYISKEAWAQIKTAREELVRIINTSASEIPAEASSQELATKIFAIFVDESSTFQHAKNTLKQEIQELF